jgi:hypothetical protein
MLCMLLAVLSADTAAAVLRSPTTTLLVVAYCEDFLRTLGSAKRLPTAAFSSRCAGPS